MPSVDPSRRLRMFKMRLNRCQLTLLIRKTLCIWFLMNVLNRITTFGTRRAVKISLKRFWLELIAGRKHLVTSHIRFASRKQTNLAQGQKKRRQRPPRRGGGNEVEKREQCCKTTILAQNRVISSRGVQSCKSRIFRGPYDPEHPIKKSSNGFNHKI